MLETAYAVVWFALGGLAGAALIFGVSRHFRRISQEVLEMRVAARFQAELASAGERTAVQREQIDGLESRLLAGEKAIQLLRQELAQAREDGVRLNTELLETRQQAKEKLLILEQAKESLTAQFKTLANEIFDEKSKRFSEQNRGELDLLLKPLGEKLQAFEKKIEDTYVNEAKERFSLAEEVRKLQALNLQIGQEALNLTRALKGESKTRGNWGEVILERILERSGLQKGREYETQVTLEAENAKLRPDVIVRLPDSKEIVIDSKVSLVAYDRYYAAQTEAERDLALREHVLSLRRHIDDLASKNYQQRAGVNAPDFVAMFVAIEPAFNLAAAAEESLFLDAFERKVVIVTPGTLLAMLSTVATLWRRDSQTRNVLEIARRSGDLYDKFVGFVESLREIGVRLGAAQVAYETASKRLVDGQGNLVRRAQELKRLGAHADKELPADLIDQAINGSPVAGNEPAERGNPAE